MSTPRLRTPSAQSQPPPLDALLAEAATHAANTPSGRDEKGRFTKGNPDGPGNPFARHVAKPRAALVQRVTEADIQRIADDLLVKAKLGHLPSIRILLPYVLGKPSGTVNPDTLDLDEWRQLVQPLPRIMAELSDALLSVPVQTATDMVRSAQPFAQRMVSEELTAPAPEAAEEANDEEAKNERREDRPAKRTARARAQPSTNGGCGGRGAVPRWLHKIAAQARMASARWREPGHGSG
jgi:hypothetical protein